MNKWICGGLLPLLLVTVLVTAAFAAPIGRITADIENLRPDRNETAFGRLLADVLREETRADIGLVYAGSLRRGTVRQGPVEQKALEALLAFGDDHIITITVNGAQLRAALERAVQAYPTGSPAFLHLSGMQAAFNAQAPINQRLTMVRVGGREVQNADSLKVAMPVSLAEGAAGYFTIWNSGNGVRAGTTLRQSLVAYITARKEVTPDPQPRFSPQ